jgi:hypothetical protein
MAPSLRRLLVRNAPSPHRYGFHTLGGLLKHVKSAHPHASFISQANETALFLQVSSFLVLPSSSIPFAFLRLVLGSI